MASRPKAGSVVGVPLQFAEYTVTRIDRHFPIRQTPLTAPRGTPLQCDDDTRMGVEVQVVADVHRLHQEAKLLETASCVRPLIRFINCPP